MAIAPKTHIDIGGIRFADIANHNLYQKNKDGTFKSDGQGGFIKKSALDHVTDYLGTSSGSFRFLQSLQKISTLAAAALKQAGYALAATFENFSSNVGKAFAPLAIPRLVDGTRKAKNAIVEWISPKKTPVDATRDAVEKIHDVADVMSTWGSVSSFVTSNKKFGTFADATGFVADTADLHTSAQDWRLARRHYEIVKLNDPKNEDMQTRFADTAKLSLIKIVKAAASIVSGIAGLLALYLGGPVLSAATLLGMSVVGTFTSVTAHFYQHTRQWDVVDFFKTRSPEVLVGGVPAV